MNEPPCHKRCYVSIRQARERTQNLGNRVRVYWCLQCNAWHTTNADFGQKHRDPEVVILRPKPYLKRKPVRAPERAAKLASKERDRWHCRYPDCPVEGRGLVHSAHLRPKRMGGDPTGLVSDKASDYVTLCPQHHRLLDERFIDAITTTAGGDGRVEFATHQRKQA